MDPIITTIPEQVNAELTPTKIIIDVVTKNALITYKKEGTLFTSNINIPTMISVATEADQDVVRLFFRQLLAAGTNVAIAAVPEVV